MSNVHKVSVSWRCHPIYDEYEYSFVLHTQCCGSWVQVRVREPRKKNMLDLFEEGLRIKCPTCDKGAEISRDDAVRMAMKVRGSGDVLERHLISEVIDG